MFTPILAEADLPSPGTPESATLDFKAVVPSDWTPFRLARQVAAFANSVGGTLLIGAKDENDALKEYRPLTEADAADVEQRYGHAVKDRCSPKPFFEPTRLAKNTGFVVAVNVWPFPGQAIGVGIRAEKKLDGTDQLAYVFPLRSGRDTSEILPEQLPMLMLPELRRIAILLATIQEKEQVEIVPADGANPSTVMNLKTVDSIANIATFIQHGLGNSINAVRVPLDRIETVWRGHANWRVVVRGRVMSGDRGLDFYLR